MKKYLLERGLRPRSDFSPRLWALKNREPWTSSSTRLRHIYSTRRSKWQMIFATPDQRTAIRLGNHIAKV
ncbi:hypothetical protein A2U01_0092461, partial [Trifolium medium]|nr:hypothetical protein [Trifolium medium]